VTAAIGGFFGLEEERERRGPWHASAPALTSGRACLRAILELVRPARIAVPFYICDAALEPIRRLGLPFDFYGLRAGLDPDRGAWPADAAVLYVNYFDLKNREAGQLDAALGPRAIIDDTQAFFRRGRPRSFSFNSSRKFFGVPDGGYAYGPDMDGVRPDAANDGAVVEHLTTRLTGPQDAAYRQYLEAERRVTCDRLAPSPLTTRLMAHIAYDDVRAARRRNFAVLHGRLAPSNMLTIDFSLDEDAAPYCYPFLPRHRSLHEALWRREIFVPRLWPEVASRPGSDFVFERDLAGRLLPLPVDHRYGADDMERMCDAICEVSR
jgi:hypothetical protein